jgi:hypothetical protein
MKMESTNLHAIHPYQLTHLFAYASRHFDVVHVLMVAERVLVLRKEGEDDALVPLPDTFSWFLIDPSAPRD